MVGRKLKPSDLILRCYAERDSDGTWFAMCIDLNLYSRAASFEEAKRKLHAVTFDYLKEALTSEHVEDLFPRRASVYFRLRYFNAWVRTKLRQVNDIRKYKEILPLTLQTA